MKAIRGFLIVECQTLLALEPKVRLAVFEDLTDAILCILEDRHRSRFSSENFYCANGNYSYCATMKNERYQRLIQCGIASSFLLLSTMSHAITTLVSANRYSVNEGVAFTLENNGASDFLFNWTDPSGAPAISFSSITDPTLVLTLGQTYTFKRTTSAHPFAIMNNTAAAFMSGADGTYSRTTSSSTDINNATLTPIATFTADPAPTTDLISWTPSQVGDFWYTCTVTGHPGMTGKIIVIPEPSAFGLIAGGFAFAAFRRRRG